MSSSTSVDLFEEVLQLGIARDRARQARRARENSAQRLTWASSQLSQPEYVEAPAESEEAELQAFSGKLAKLLRSVNAASLSEVIISKVSHVSFIGFMRTIMDSCKDLKTDDGAMLTLAFYDAIISVYERSGEVARQNEIFDELLQKVGSLPDHSLASLAHRLISCCITNDADESSSKKKKLGDKGRSSLLLNLFVKLLNKAKSLPKGSVDPKGLLNDMDASEFTGEVFFNSTVLLLCEAEWPPEFVVPLLTALCDLSRGNASVFNRDAINAIQEKVSAQMDRAPKKDLAEAYSVMLLLSSLQGWMKAAVSLFVENLQLLEDDDAYPVVSGGVISRLTALVSHDIRLGSTVLKHLENLSDWSLTCYIILLALMRVKRFEQSAVEVIRNLAFKSAQTECQDICQSPWMTQLKNLEESFNELGSGTLFKLSEALLTVCDMAHKHEWDLIIPSLLKTGLRLADEDNALNQDLPAFFDCVFEGKENNPKMMVSFVGVQILVKCYQVFAITRFELQNFIVERALISDTSHGALPAIRFLFMLSSKDQCARTLFYEHATSVKDLITLLPSVSPRVAHGLLRGLSKALAPGTAFREIRDHAFLVFRKSLFQRDSETRKIGMLGFIACCKPVQASHKDVADEVDALAALKRCLTQQYELRVALYKALSGFPAEFKSNILISHFLGYVDQTDDRDIPPLHFDRCIDGATGVVTEPISHLVAVFSGSNDVLTQLQIERLADADLALFSLDKDSNFDSTSVQGRTNRSTVALVVEVCEVFIDRMVSEAARDTTVPLNQSPNAGTIAALFRVMRGLRRIAWKDDVITADGAEKGKRGRPKKGADGKSKKLKVSDDAGDEEVEEDDENKENDRLRDYLTKPPAKGAFFSDSTLTLLLKTLSSVTANVLLESVTSPQKSSRRDFAGLISNLTTHEFVLQAVHVRMFELQRVVAGLKGREKGVASNDVSSTVSQFSGMTESCAGIKPPVVGDITPEIARLVYRQFKRYLSAEKLSGNGSSQTSESRAAANGAESNNSPSFQSLWVKTLEVLHDIISVAERTSLQTLIGTLSVISEWMPKADGEAAAPQDDSEDAKNDCILHSATSAVLDMLESDMSWRDPRAVSALLGILECILSRVSSSPANIERMSAHVARMRDILRFNDASKQLVLVKQIVKVYLDLAVRSSEIDFSPAFLALVSASSTTLERAALPMAKKSKKQAKDENDLSMEVEGEGDQSAKTWMMLRTPVCASAAITAVLQALCTHGLDGCERMLSASSLVIGSSIAQSLWVGRVHSVMKVLAELLGAASHKTAIGDPILRCAVRTYKCLTRFLRKVTMRKEVMSADSLTSLVRFCSENIVGKLDSCLQRLEESSSGGKVAPEVVFALEQYEVVLLKAAKACPSINTLGKYAKRLTARDFKFHPERLKHALATKEEEEASTHANEGGEEEE